MNRSDLRRILRLVPGAALASLLTFSGCGFYSHPNDSKAVYNLLIKNDLRSVTLSQNRRSGVITLNGTVGTAGKKSLAETLAQQAAPGYTIANNIRVEPTGLESEVKSAEATSALDHEIIMHYAKKIEKNKNLGKEHIQYSAYNGILTLRGSVKTAAEKTAAEEIAKRIPQIRSVVNDLAIKHGGHHTSNS